MPADDDPADGIAMAQRRVQDINVEPLAGAGLFPPLLETDGFSGEALLEFLTDAAIHMLFAEDVVDTHAPYAVLRQVEKGGVGRVDHQVAEVCTYDSELVTRAGDGGLVNFQVCQRPAVRTDVAYQTDNVLRVRGDCQPGLEPDRPVGHLQLVLAGLQLSRGSAALDSCLERACNRIGQQVFRA